MPHTTLIARFVGLAVLSSAIAGEAAAQDAFIRSVIGYSETTCRTWMRNRAARLSYPMEMWALGFVSGSNWASLGNDRLKDTNADAIERWLDDYCQANPLKTFPTAVRNLAIELDRRAQ